MSRFDPQSLETSSGLVQVLDENGDVSNKRLAPDLSDRELLEMYRHMKFARYFDTKAISLQRQGRLGTYPPVAGHEGAQIASTLALRRGDWVVPTYRESAVPLTRGVSAEDVLLYWMGHEEANAAFAKRQIFPICITIAGQIPHAVGMGMAANIKGANEEAMLCHFGDGATSEGDFHEGLNFAGVFNTPTVFLCNNNQWAISVPRERQTASATLAQKALAYGFEGIRVDGMDPLAMYAVTRAALERATDGSERSRQTFIEAVLYRFRAHTTADDPSVYRDESAVAEWKGKDPITRMELFLKKTGRLDSDHVAAIEIEIEEEVSAAVEATSDFETKPVEMVDNVFASLPEELNEQADWLDGLAETEE